MKSRFGRGPAKGADRLGAPRLAVTLLSLTLPPKDRSEVLDSLGEDFRWRTEESGRARARRWYWGQTLHFLVRMPAVRLREKLRRSGGAPDDESANHLSASSGTSTLRLADDLRAAVRTLKRSPGFAAVIVAILALGIGVNSAMFGILHSTLLRPLPFPDSHDLVLGRTSFEGRLNPWGSARDFVDYRDNAEALGQLGAIMPFPMDVTVTGGEFPERVASTVVSPGMFNTVGVDPQLGRDFSESDGAAGAPDVVVISDRYWQARFGAARDVVGRSLTVQGTPFTIIGVMPADFRFMVDVDLWRPMRPDRDAAGRRDAHNWLMVGRLAAGTTMAEAQNQVDVVSSRLQQAYPESNQTKRLLLTPLQGALAEGFRTGLIVLTGAVTLVLLIAGANVAGMFLARAPRRRAELSIRAALGASRGRLVSQLVMEGLILALLGGVVGTGVAFATQSMLLQSIADQGQTLASSAALSGGTPGIVLLLALCFSILTGLLAALYPAMTGARTAIAEHLKSGGRRMSTGGTRLRSGLVIVQVATSLVLLVGATLMVRSFAHVLSVDPGFDDENLLTAEVALPAADYPEAVDQIQFFRQLQDEILSIPGVTGVGMINNLPFRNPGNTFHAIRPGVPESDRSVKMRSALPGYIDAMGMQLVRGRDIEETDDRGASNVVVITGRTAEWFFPESDALGQVLSVDFFGTPFDAEVIGVVADARLESLELGDDLAVYFSYAQRTYPRLRIAVRTAVDPLSVAPAVRAAVAEMDPNLPVSGIGLMEELVAGSVLSRRAMATVMSLFGVLPLIMATVGLYSLLAYHVRERFREIGIRMSLGARPMRLAGHVVLRGFSLAGIGVLVGVIAARWLTGSISALLYGIEATDLSTFIGVVGFVLVISVSACLIPAIGAVRVDPLASLRAE
jgi:putative ABC transport system permease protein